MDGTAEHFANRCLPLLIANQAGWVATNSRAFSAQWNGRVDESGVRVQFDEPGVFGAVSHFGFGILTWNLPWLFRTPSGWQLWVRGPTNAPKDGIYPLDGIVETDWTDATFTMNWRFTRPGRTIRFEQGEPFCQLIPIQVSSLERFQPEEHPLASDARLQEAYFDWSAKRTAFQQQLKEPGSSERKAGWQKHYFQGKHLDGTLAREHRTKLSLPDARSGLVGADEPD